MLRLELSRSGCRVTGAGDAGQALAALKETAFDWLVVDGQIYPINGFELAAKAKKAQPRIKIVMISGIYDLADIAGHPIGTLFQKPIDADALSSCLHGAGPAA